MGNRERRPLLFVENCMADVADAQMALDSLWTRLYKLCYKPAVTLDDVEVMGEDLRRVERGLAAVRGLLVEERARVGEGGAMGERGWTERDGVKGRT